ADSKALAQLIKDLFPNPDQQAGQNGNPFASRFSRYRGMMSAMMGGGGPGGGDNGGENNGHTPTAKVNAVSDDHANAVVVSAPDELMPMIKNLVDDLDTPVDAVTVVKTYHLHNADATELAATITSVFSDDTSTQTDASRSPSFAFGRFPFFPQQNNTANSSSDRMKRMAHVTAVADPRTQSLIVTAGTNMLEQIDQVVNELDGSDARKVKPFYISLQNADPADVLPILQGLFPPMSGMNIPNSATSMQQNFLANRAYQQLQNQNNQNSTSGFGSMGVGTGRGL
ncbi:MAG TPA: secretin N-terminal domain-containing protein, partial [Verrucomicrobiae bacterium]|nr:secretin N-terminal domain-containing protein [Verrucomicrobiae bacterium]